ncbi:MAG: hypothetical protein FWD47_14095 [Treponema sp.]|nr:hypothetical protein [Treponema sp.]
MKISTAIYMEITHVFNHQTHHRGMISLYLEMLGKENSFSDSMYNTEMY